MKIYIASSENHLGKIQEDIYIRDAFISKGIPSEIVTLKDIVKNSKLYDVVILKSIWGYHLNYKEFLLQISTIKKKRVKLINDYDFIRWNIHKYKYLNEIKDINVIPTYHLDIKQAQTALDIRNAISKASRNFNVKKLVIKPSISESGYLTYVYNANQENEKVVDSLRLNKHLDFIIQPFRPSIVKGEISVIINNGKPIYGVTRFPGVLGSKKDTGYLNLASISSSIIKTVSILEEFFLKKFGTLPNICRVDFLENTRDYEILEVELIDPDLFFRYIPVRMRKKAISTLVDTFSK